MIPVFKFQVVSILPKKLPKVFPDDRRPPESRSRKEGLNSHRYHYFAHNLCEVHGLWVFFSHL
jgi:hypothetical protein